jgi:hypothetical protein
MIILIKETFRVWVRPKEISLSGVFYTSICEIHDCIHPIEQRVSLNLGYSLGYASSSQGVRGILNHIKITPQKVNERSFGGKRKGSILIWGYVMGFNIDLGVRE